MAVELEVDFKGLEKLDRDELVVFGSEFAKRYPEEAKALFDGIAEELKDDAIADAIYEHADPSTLAETLVKLDENTAEELAEYIYQNLSGFYKNQFLNATELIEADECERQVEEAKEECENGA